MALTKNDNRIKGIGFIILAGCFFALMNLVVRMSGDLPNMQKAFFRNIVATLVATISILKNHGSFHVPRKARLDIAARCIMGTVGILCNFYAVSTIGFADANMMNKMSPFFAVLFSIILLKEFASKVDWLTLCIAFGGALLIIKPSFHMETLQALIGLLGGMAAGLAYTFVRRMRSKGVTGSIIVFYFSLFSTIVCLPKLLLDFRPMSARQWVLLLLCGVFAAGGQLSITAAYTFAPASELAVFDYSQVLFSALLGFLFLSELPDVYSVLGYIIIIGVAVFRWYRGLPKKQTHDLSNP